MTDIYSTGHLTQSHALDMLRGMLKLLLKARSSMREGAIDPNVLEDLYPWLFGDKCVLPALSGVIDRAEQSGTLSPMDFFNQMTVLYRFMPTLVAVAPITLGSKLLPAEPPDHMVYLRGWAPEPLAAGMQVIYVPNHANGSTWHIDCERGFVTSLNQDGAHAFVRYWSKSNPGTLRTRANSECTPIANLVIKDTVDQALVDQCLANIDQGLDPHHTEESNHD